MEWTAPTQAGRLKTIRMRAPRWLRGLLVLAAGGGLLAATLSSTAQEPPATYRPARASVQMGAGPTTDVGPGLRVPGRPPGRASAVIESSPTVIGSPTPTDGGAALPPGHDATRATVTFEPAEASPPPQVVPQVEMPVRAEFPAARKTDVSQAPPKVLQDPLLPKAAATTPESRPAMRTSVVEQPVVNPEPAATVNAETPKVVNAAPIQETPVKFEVPREAEAPKATVQEQPAKVESPATRPDASKAVTPTRVQEPPPAAVKPDAPKTPARPTVAQDKPVTAERPPATKPDAPKAAPTVVQEQPVKTVKTEAPKSTIVQEPPAKVQSSTATKPLEAPMTRATAVQESKVATQPERKPEAAPASDPTVVTQQPAKVEVKKPAPPSAPPAVVQERPVKVEPPPAARTIVQTPPAKETTPAVRPAVFQEPKRPTELIPTPKAELKRLVREATLQETPPKTEIRPAGKPDAQQPVRTAAFQEQPKTEIMPAPRSAPRPLQTPSVIDPFNPTRIRLPRLGYDGGARARRHGEPTPAGPQLSEDELKEYGQFVQEMVDPRSTLDLIVGRPRLMILKEVPTKTQIGDDEIAGIQLIGPRQISLLARKTGTTVLNMWFTDPQDRNKERILSYLIRVLPDPDAKARLEQIYKALADEINEAFPDSYINLTLVGDKLVVSGQAKDIAEATQILRIVRSQAPDQETAQIPFQNVQVAFAPEDVRDMRDFFLAGGPNVINLIRVPGEQQVMLRVTVAEVNRAAARSIGLNFSIANDNGVTVFSQLTGGILGSTELNNLPIALDNGQINLAVNALRRMDYASSLAEPVLTTMNGQTATFQAGGQFPVPVVTGFTASGLQGVSFIPFGVLLNFTPYITDKDRIRLNVAAEVSTRDLESGTQIQGADVSGLSTRNFQTTVELREGQTLCVAGLLQVNEGAKSARVPLFGDIPILGRLASFDRLSSGEQELVILITPELVHPLEPEELMPLPGSDVVEPGDLEFYLLGRLESRREYNYRSTVRTDIHRMLRYRHCEDVYIYGPKGHGEGPVINLSELHGPHPLHGHPPANGHYPVNGPPVNGRHPANGPRPDLKGHKAHK